MNIDILLQLAHDSASYCRLLSDISEKNVSAQVLEEARPYLIASLYRDLKQPVLIITSCAEKTRRMAEHLSVWLDSRDMLEFPEPDSLPYSRISPDSSTTIEKLRILSQMIHPAPSSKPLFMIVSVTALMQKLPSSQRFRSGWMKIKKGKDIEPQKLISFLARHGYKSENLVEIPGCFSHRGGIVDIFPLSSNCR
jgi:transcription-repair coupling factor (superfamily II helicase)